ncbi:MAG: hypothetical protein MJ211_10205, partial [Bacteroidales bacterium]|nr:hypothetical protein [Bacteroidales bacterium]
LKKCVKSDKFSLGKCVKGVLMIKPIDKGYVFKLPPKIKQIYTSNKVVDIFNDGEKITKTYIDLNTSKIIKKIIEWIKE